MSKQDDVQVHFIELLTILTNSGKIQWVRSKNDSGFVYGLAGGELIVFEVRGGDGGKLVDIMEAVTGVVGKCRNISYLWLEPSPGFLDLLKLLRRAPIDDECFVQFRKQAHITPVKMLESL